ncbi:hypothetical protein [Adlercreutzia sp. ZJ304]|uniref:lipopolysaccharide biosynthesis protein n=1 Tax=Adlercreutzia sp. ZJ304 TaxID=2709791 RepID=UPI0013ED76CC|nr:hypothetical protein [Adlercreutzia sp. ZJ304]
MIATLYLYTIGELSSYLIIKLSRQNEKTRAAMLTMVTSVINVGIVALFGLIYTQKLMEVYGSSINGLISTLIQFVSLFTALEGGLTTAAIVALYGPVVNQNYKKIGLILGNMRKVFIIIGVCIAALTLPLGIVYIDIIDSPISYNQTLAMLVITIINVVISIAFQSNFIVIFSGFNKQFIQYILSTIARTITWIAAMMLIVTNQNIVIVYLVYSTSIVLSVTFFWIWKRHSLKEVTYCRTKKLKLPNGSRDVFVQKIANTVFTSTDLVVISAGVSLTQASIFFVYNQIFMLLSNVLSSIANAPANSLGHLHNDLQETHFIERLSIYQNLIIIIASILLTSASMSILGFIRIYTRNVSDTGYIFPVLVFLLYTQYYLIFCNRPFGTTLNITGNFKDQNAQCIVAAIVNVFVSIILVKLLGVLGAVIGSICGVVIIFSVGLVKCVKRGLILKTHKVILLLGCNYVLGLMLIYWSIFFCYFEPTNYITWGLMTLLYACIVATCYILIGIIFAKPAMVYAFNLVRRKFV